MVASECPVDILDLVPLELSYRLSSSGCAASGSFTWRDAFDSFFINRVRRIFFLGLVTLELPYRLGRSGCAASGPFTWRDAFDSFFINRVVRIFSLSTLSIRPFLFFNLSQSRITRECVQCRVHLEVIVLAREVLRAPSLRVFIFIIR